MTEPSASRRPSPSVAARGAVAVADLTGDGVPDLVVANYNDDTISVLVGKGDGTFLPQEVFAVEAKPYSLAVADLTGDGRLDIVVANSASDTVSVLMNLGGNNDHVYFVPQVTFAAGMQPFSVAVADLSGDGIPDIITANAASNTISVLMGQGGGSFRSQHLYAVGSRPDPGGRRRLDRRRQARHRRDQLRRQQRERPLEQW